MLFNSWAYLVFLIVGISLYYLLPSRLRVGFICLASLVFYSMWKWQFTFLLIFSAFIDFCCARRISMSTRAAHRLAFLILTLSINIGLLIFFKYTYFLLDNVSVLAGVLGYNDLDFRNIGFSIILPLGISFYTFQTISYTIDVYRGVISAEKSFPTFLTYVVFWPHLIAGPILRSVELMPQIKTIHSFRWDNILKGTEILVIGLFKKIVLADNFAKLVDFWFEKDAGALTAFDVWVACFAFGLQIYFDFSGYSDIAIGSARMLGIQLTENFDWPYMALSPKDFWKRWHITLSSWIRDYLYLPLTGQRFQTTSAGGIAIDDTKSASEGRRAAALLGTWFIMGLWHGAAWTFALWGVYHGLLVLVYRVCKPLKRLPQWNPAVAWVLMLFLSMAGWIFFRAQSLSQALTMFATILNPMKYKTSLLVTGMSSRLAGYSYMWVPLVIAGMVCLYIFRLKISSQYEMALSYSVGKSIAMAVMICLMLIYMGTGQNQFIYFQF